MNDLAIVMPMAGRGTRFSKLGITTPKPLIEIEGRPFFWWAIESLRQRLSIREIVFVVLKEHCVKYEMESRILDFYPDANIVAIENVTSGAAETAAIGLRELSQPGPVAVNDCDHAFDCTGFEGVVQQLSDQTADAALMCFNSTSPAYSYAVFDDNGYVRNTVEKKVVSSHAIAGCYLFASNELFLREYEEYKVQCSYEELFISGMYNMLAQRNSTLIAAELKRHWSFGTPEEYSAIDNAELKDMFVP